ncbi:polysaccharide biosynthesis protein [Proteiniclasticum sp. QWL-01]|uniref:putative polysaccharide biosynthesis protein n=1 Tax=Proteiniclasticum sp. QWL-01 TaxID=3036945 RepID=UPI00241035F8|nr:polysaccharide biosynthesis protein [Proteiniclasticum sp. QWL-01]WFF72029.1 polysaccharide biosynthesis protein [Proteiniclasticum sp. QWL-01]
MRIKEESTSKSFMILTVATFLTKIMSLIYVPLLLNIIQAEAHGVYTTAYEFFAFAYVITNEGITKGIAKMVSDRMARQDVAAAHKVFRISRTILLALGVVVSVIFFLAAGSLAQISGAPTSVNSLRILAPAIAVTSATSAYRGYFQGRRLLSMKAVSQIWEQAVNVVVSLVLALVLIRFGIQYGVAGAASGTLFGALVAAAYLAWQYRRTSAEEPGGRSKDGTERRILRELMAYTIPLAIGTAATQFGHIIDLVNVKTRLLVSGLDVAGANVTYSFLSSYKTIIAVPLTILVALTTSLFPSLARASSLGDYEEVRRKYRMALKINYLLAFPSAIGLYAVSGPANIAMFDGEPVRGLLIAMGSFVVILQGITLMQTVLLQALGLHRKSLVPLLIGIAVKIIANYFLVALPELRGQGAIISSYLQGIVTLGLNEYLIHQNLKLSINQVQIARRPLLASLIMGGALILLQQVLPDVAGRSANGIQLILLMGVGIAAYSVALLLLGGITRADLNAIRPGLANKVPSSIQRFLRVQE